jgi:serine protease Do
MMNVLDQRGKRRHATPFWLPLLFAVLPAIPASAQQAETYTPAAASLIRQQQLVFRHALRSVMPAIVRIDTIGGAQPVRQEMNVMQQQRVTAGFRQADGPTTGLIWSSDGYILTSSFNFARDPVVITVTLSDGRRYVARLVARDRPARLALLKIDAADLPVPRWVDVDELRPGQWALAAGWGYAGAEPAVTVGVLSALQRMDGRAVQTDAKISPANYGGPLFDIEGRVIGICVPMGPGEDELAGVEWYDSGIGFAIRGEHVRRRVPRLIAGEELHHGLLGINLDTREQVFGGDSDEDVNGGQAASGSGGLRIIGPPRGPAAEAGLQPDDVITHIDGEPTPRIVDFRRLVARKAAGDTISVTYRRGPQSASVTLTLASAEDFRGPPTSQPK